MGRAFAPGRYALIAGSFTWSIANRNPIFRHLAGYGLVNVVSSGFLLERAVGSHLHSVHGFAQRRLLACFAGSSQRALANADVAI
jgi:hypothetical protein